MAFSCKITSSCQYVPAQNEAGVTEGGKSLNKVHGVKFLRMQDGAAVYAVDSGTYRFQSTLAISSAQLSK